MTEKGVAQASAAPVVPGRVPRLERTGRALVVPAAIVAAILILNFGSVPGRLSLGQLIVIYLAITAALELSRLARHGLRRRAEQEAARRIASFGGGLYGTLAVATFAYLEVMDIWADVGEAGSLGGFFSSITVVWLIRQLIESFLFGIKAMLWPWYWLIGYGPAVPLLVMLGTWGLDAAVLRLQRRRAGWRAAEVEPA